MKGFMATALLLASVVGAQESGPPLEEAAAPIQDNSFLIEEAYNQPAGVVQHISTFSVDRGSSSWAYTFTQEWPLFSQLHQLSYTLPLPRDEARFGTGFGDVALNYRYQVPMRGRPELAVAPRVSVLLPTGSVAKARGSGGAGFQANLPISAAISKSFVTHFNAGATYTPSAENSLGDKAATTGFNAGQSLIWLLRPELNLMLELAWESTEEILDGGSRDRSEGLLLAPGIRGAINFANGLQVVPGIAVPIGLGPSRGERSLFFYLSFEHPFTNSVRQEGK